jgi:hypothetical protein
MSWDILGQITSSHGKAIQKYLKGHENCFKIAC